MRDIHPFLEKFRHLTPPHRSIRVAACAVVREELGVLLEERSMSVHEGVVYLSANGPLKHAVHMRKQELLSSINRRLGVAEAVRDIR